MFSFGIGLLFESASFTIKSSVVPGTGVIESLDTFINVDGTPGFA